MLRRIVREILVVIGGVMFFLGLCASVGISINTPPSPSAESEDSPPTVPRPPQASPPLENALPENKAELGGAAWPASESTCSGSFSGRKSVGSGL